MCPYCDNSKQITATRTSWQIHLAGHREEIIKHLTDISESCELCAYAEMSANKKHAASHYRWSHQKHEIIEWALSKLDREIIV
ncbi:hypothetical protein C5F47_07275 [Nitrosopumilus cobalaminigenes]|uniref:Uncharacterized protein n=2 Tax=Nitrosopumilus cobalaminigenes TaxID=1470066 RepID=A0A7D5QZG1_9ARCH|nr:hypothetical protein C5F47_07275 [Nitrosopumilus cobalaminigenes]